MKRRFAHAAAWMAALTMTLCACGAETAPTPAPPAAFEQPQYEWGTVSGRTLTVWGRTTDLSRSYITKAFARYEEKTGNTVETVAFAPEELEQAAARGLRDGARGPDLILSFGGTNMDAYDPDQNLYDFSEAEWVDDLADVSINQTIYHGKVIGLPHWEASISGTLYNKEIFERLSLTPPRTQQEFLDTCETLLQNGVTPLYLPGASPTMLLYQFPLDAILEEAGVLDGLNGGDTGYADLPGMYTVLEWYRTMAERGYLGTDCLTNDWDGMSGALESGQYAMMLCWDTWLYTDFTGDAARFGLMPAFAGLPEEGTFEGPNLSLLLVNRNGKQVEAAVDLITFMADPYNYNKAFEGIYTAPVFKRQAAGISTPQYAEASQWIDQNFRDSTAWLRIRGFSQSDAACIIDYMQGKPGYTAEQCLRDMDARRRQRLQDQTKKVG